MNILPMVQWFRQRKDRRAQRRRERRIQSLLSAGWGRGCWTPWRWLRERRWARMMEPAVAMVIGVDEGKIGGDVSVLHGLGGGLQQTLDRICRDDFGDTLHREQGLRGAMDQDRVEVNWKIQHPQMTNQRNAGYLQGGLANSVGAQRFTGGERRSVDLHQRILLEAGEWCDPSFLWSVHREPDKRLVVLSGFQRGTGIRFVSIEFSDVDIRSFTSCDDLRTNARRRIQKAVAAQAEWMSRRR